MSHTPLVQNGHGPLTETTFLILLSLAPRSQHGYAIMKDVASLSENRIQLSTGTLYGALSRLLEQEWIERVENEKIEETNRQRKAYQLTELGRKMLNAEVHRLSRLLSLAQLRQIEGDA